MFEWENYLEFLIQLEIPTYNLLLVVIYILLIKNGFKSET